MRLLIDKIDTPIGVLLLVADCDGLLRAVDWANYEDRMRRLLRLHYGRDEYRFEEARNPHGLRDRMERYFAGDVSAIDGIAVQTGGTAFQRAVWQELRSVPSGSVISYSQLAERVERRKAVRAVGTANGANPVGIVVPRSSRGGSEWIAYRLRRRFGTQEMAARA